MLYLTHIPAPGPPPPNELLVGFAVENPVAAIFEAWEAYLEHPLRHEGVDAPSPDDLGLLAHTYQARVPYSPQQKQDYQRKRTAKIMADPALRAAKQEADRRRRRAMYLRDKADPVRWAKRVAARRALLSRGRTAAERAANVTKNA